MCIFFFLKKKDLKPMQNLEKENELLRKRIAELEEKLEAKTPTAVSPDEKISSFEKVDKLTNHEIFRFGRQLVTPKFGYECTSLNFFCLNLQLTFHNNSTVKITKQILFDRWCRRIRRSRSSLFRGRWCRSTWYSRSRRSGCQ